MEEDEWQQEGQEEQEVASIILEISRLVIM